MNPELVPEATAGTPPDFIEAYPHALSDAECQAIIQRFEESGEAAPGCVGGGLIPELKDSRDITISGLDHWSDVEQLLNAAMVSCFKTYVRRYCYALLAPFMLQWEDRSTGRIRRIVEGDFAAMPAAELSALVSRCFRPGEINLQHYRADTGGYPDWHCELFPRDESCEQLHRHLLWTLNLNDGFGEGETEFLYQQRRITPQRGLLLIAPCAFTHTHRGHRPIGRDKYIATSWVLFQRPEALFLGEQCSRGIESRNQGTASRLASSGIDPRTDSNNTSPQRTTTTPPTPASLSLGHREKTVRSGLAESPASPASPPATDAMTLALKDLILRLSIADHAPPTLNPGFLQGAAVVPADWTLAQEPICSAEGAQLVYENGLILLAQGQLVSGQEPLDGSAAETPQLAELLVRYCQALPKLQYQGLQTVLRVVILYGDDPDGARRTICERLLQPGEWQTFGQEPLQPTLQLGYQLDGQVLALTVAPAQVRQDENVKGSALVFAGSFEQRLAEGERLPQVESLLRGWTERRDLLLDLITNRFPLS